MINLLDLWMHRVVGRTRKLLTSCVIRQDDMTNRVNVVATIFMIACAVVCCVRERVW